MLGGEEGGGRLAVLEKNALSLSLWHKHLYSEQALLNPTMSMLHDNILQLDLASRKIQ